MARGHRPALAVEHQPDQQAGLLAFEPACRPRGVDLDRLHHLRHRGHDVILFHILDEAEVHFPFEGTIEFEDVEEERKLTLDARGMRPDYLKSLAEFQAFYRTECAKANIDYVAMDTSVSFDKALMEYLLQRQRRL